MHKITPLGLSFTLLGDQRTYWRTQPGDSCICSSCCPSQTARQLLGLASMTTSSRTSQEPRPRPHRHQHWLRRCAAARQASQSGCLPGWRRHLVQQDLGLQGEGCWASGRGCAGQAMAGLGYSPWFDQGWAPWKRSRASATLASATVAGDARGSGLY